jgi:hypothetical protein
VKTWCLSQLCCFLTDFCNFWLILKLRDGAINPNQWSSLWPVATAFYQLHIIKQSYITVTVTDQTCRETRPSVQFFWSYFWSRFSLVAGPMDQTLKHHAFLTTSMRVGWPPTLVKNWFEPMGNLLQVQVGGRWTRLKTHTWYLLGESWGNPEITCGLPMQWFWLARTGVWHQCSYWSTLVISEWHR